MLHQTHCYSLAMVHFHTTVVIINVMSDGESALFTDLVFGTVKRESQRGEKCNHIKAKQVPAGEEEFGGVATCENVAKSNTPVRHEG